jgi:hypothetical protein
MKRSSREGTWILCTGKLAIPLLSLKIGGDLNIQEMD